MVEHVTFGVHVTIRYVACFDERFGGLIINAFRQAHRLNRHPKPLVGRIVAYDVACFQLNHTVGMFQLVRMVRNENDGGAAVLQFVQHPHDVGAPLRVEHGGRLVEHEHVGIHRQHAGDGDALLLAAAHARRVGSAIVAHIHGVQRTRDAQSDLIMFNRKILRSERHVVFGDGGDDLVFGMLEHRADAATGGSILVGVRTGLVEHHIA